jgi:2',3'-cyclic-nucleotide 2'-phosphodiesterase / 3'-nucleotidase
LTKGSGIPREKLVEHIEKSTDIDLRFYMIQWIEKHGNILPPEWKNWEVIPAEWVQQAKERDLSTLFPR